MLISRIEGRKLCLVELLFHLSDKLCKIEHRLQYIKSQTKNLIHHKAHGTNNYLRSFSIYQRVGRLSM